MGSRASLRTASGVLLMLFAAGAGSNGLGGEDCDDLRGLPINVGVEWESDIKPIINEEFETGRCTSCHNPGQFDGDLDLTDIGIDAIYKLIPPGYVVPGRPLDSPLFDKTNCNAPGFGGPRMPFFQNPLTLAQQALIYDWIAQGARGDVKGEPPIPRDFIFRDGSESRRWY